MNTSDAAARRKGILEQVASGQISVEEAAALLAQSNRGVDETPVEAGKPIEPEVRAEADLGGEREPQASSAPGAEAVTPQVESPGPPAGTTMPDEGRWFHVRVSDLQSGRARVHVNIPLSWVRFGLRLGGRFVPEVNGVNLNDLADPVKAGLKGQIIDVTDWDDGERVEIYVD